MLNNFKKRTIKFSGVASLVISIGIFVYYYQEFFPSTFFIIRVAGFTSLYLILALASQDPSPLEDILVQVWTINRKDKIKAEVKLEMILSFLERAITKWYGLFRRFQEIVNDDYQYSGKLKRLKENGKKVTQGEINIEQMSWIFSYLCYSIVISANLINISAPIDFLINIGFFIMILFASGGIKGIGTALVEIFETIKPEKGRKIEIQLHSLEKLIVQGSHSYYFFDIEREERMMKKQMLGECSEA